MFRICQDLHRGFVFMVTLVEVCYVVRTFRFPPAFLFRPAVSSLALGRATFPPGEGIFEAFGDRNAGDGVPNRTT